MLKLKHLENILFQYYKYYQNILNIFHVNIVNIGDGLGLSDIVTTAPWIEPFIFSIKRRSQYIIRNKSHDTDGPQWCVYQMA